jgi:hypothetical protein
MESSTEAAAAAAATPADVGQKRPRHQQQQLPLPDDKETTTPVTTLTTTTKTTTKTTTTTTNTKPKNQKNPNDDPYRIAYQGFTYTPIASTGRPGTPHAFFAESYDVHFDNSSREHPPAAGETTSRILPDQATNTTTTTTIPNWRIHKHSNGLCIVTTTSAAAANDDDDTRLVSTTAVEIVATPVPACSLGTKRKRQSKMLRGKQLQQQQQQELGTILPQNVLCHITTILQEEEEEQQKETAAAVVADIGKEGTVAGNDSTFATCGTDGLSMDSSSPTTKTTRTRQQLLCGVWGTVLEVNPRLTVDLLRKDPLLSGYIAVILPTGPFPPSW